MHREEIRKNKTDCSEKQVPASYENSFTHALVREIEEFVLDPFGNGQPVLTGTAGQWYCDPRDFVLLAIRTAAFWVFCMRFKWL